MYKQVVSHIITSEIYPKTLYISTSLSTCFLGIQQKSNKNYNTHISVNQTDINRILTRSTLIIAIIRYS